MKSNWEVVLLKHFKKPLNCSTVTKVPNLNNQKEACLINTKLKQLCPWNELQRISLQVQP